MSVTTNTCLKGTISFISLLSFYVNSVYLDKHFGMDILCFIVYPKNTDIFTNLG